MSDTSTLFTVYGTPGDDSLIGTNGDDLLDSGDGNDQLQGLAGVDLLNGGTGNDQLDGGSGNDSYLFAAGDGFDSIWEGSGIAGPEVGGTDTVQLGDGYDPAITILERWGNDLIIRNAQTNDEIAIFEHFGSDYDGSTRAAIERIEFADGTFWDATAINNRLTMFNSNQPTEIGDTIGGTPWSDFIQAMGGHDTVSGGEGDDFLDGGTGNDHLFGGQGHDFLLGGEGNDLLAGGTGDDLLDGGDGNDTYVFNSGDGFDTIYDMPMAPEESNHMVFGTGISFADLFAYEDYSIGGVTIEVGTAGDRLQLTASMADPYGPHTVSTFQFADGTIATYEAVLNFGTYQQGNEFNDWLYGTYYADSLYGSGGDDTLYGEAGDDILGGGRGNDYLSGGEGHDTYYYNRGDGADFIDDIAMPLEGNRVVFGEEIRVDDLQLYNDGWSAWIEIAPVEGAIPTGPIDLLQFSNFFPLDAAAPRSIETFAFSDGSTLGYEELIARGFYVGGTDWNDDLIGGDYNDRMYGYDGDDWLQGMAGNDYLIGGSGNDQLDGGTGNDIYEFAAGDGFDMVWEGSGTPQAGGFDTVKLGTQLAAETTNLWRNGDDLLINFQHGSDIIVMEHYSSDQQAIEQIMFSDGTIWNGEAIANRIASGNSNWTTESGDTVGGTLWSDYINGMGGNDTLSGGKDDDSIFGGQGDDRLFGSEGDDFLVGEEGNDVLSGGTGNDWLEGGLGSDNYLFTTGDGIDTINNYDIDVASIDILGFTDVSFENLWFSRSANNLQINVTGTDDQLTITNWYDSNIYQLDQIHAGSSLLLNEDVGQLVSAMSLYEVPVGEGYAVSQDIMDALQPIFTEVWL